MSLRAFISCSLKHVMSASKFFNIRWTVFQKSLLCKCITSALKIFFHKFHLHELFFGDALFDCQAAWLLSNKNLWWICQRQEINKTFILYSALFLIKTASTCTYKPYKIYVHKIIQTKMMHFDKFLIYNCSTIYC